MLALLLSYADMVGILVKCSHVPSELVRSRMQELSRDQYRDWTSSARVMHGQKLNKALLKYS